MIDEVRPCNYPVGRDEVEKSCEIRFITVKNKKIINDELFVFKKLEGEQNTFSVPIESLPTSLVKKISKKYDEENILVPRETIEDKHQEI